MDSLRALADRLKAAKHFAMRVLPDRPSAMRASIAGLAFSTAPRDAEYVPTGHRALGAIPSMPIADVLANAPEREVLPRDGGFFKVPRVIG